MAKIVFSNSLQKANHSIKIPTRQHIQQYNVNVVRIEKRELQFIFCLVLGNSLKIYYPIVNIFGVVPQLTILLPLRMVPICRGDRPPMVMLILWDPNPLGTVVDPGVGTVSKPSK